MKGESLFLTVVLVFVGSVVPAQCWELQSNKNRMTDEVTNWVFVDSKPDSQTSRHGKSIRARLEVSCWGDYFTNRISFSEPAGLGVMNFSYRFDEGNVGFDDSTFANDGLSALLFVLASEQAAKYLLTKNRLRMEVSWLGDKPGFFDFDLSGGKEALAKLDCKPSALKKFNKAIVK